MSNSLVQFLELVIHSHSMGSDHYPICIQEIHDGSVDRRDFGGQVNWEGVWPELNSFIDQVYEEGFDHQIQEVTHVINKHTVRVPVNRKNFPPWWGDSYLLAL